MALTHSELVEHVLGIVRREATQQESVINLDSRVEDVNIDSIDLINILFLLEDEYSVVIDMDIQEHVETVGDLIEALIAFIPHDEDSK